MDSSIGPADQNYPVIQNASPTYTSPEARAAAQTAATVPAATSQAAATAPAATAAAAVPATTTSATAPVSAVSAVPASQTSTLSTAAAVPGAEAPGQPQPVPVVNAVPSATSQAGVIKPYIPDEALQNPDNAQAYQAGTAAGIVTAAGAGTAATATAATTTPASTLPPVDSYTAAEVAAMPDYASTSGRRSCDPRLNNSMLAIAPNLAASLSSKLNVESGKIYVAPTVIPAEYTDCLNDVSASVKAGIQKSGKFLVSSSSQASTVQNYGPRIIPELIRACKRDDIPYLAVSVVHKIGGKPALTIRIIRVSDGVTLTQRYQHLQA